MTHVSSVACYDVIYGALCGALSVVLAVMIRHTIQLINEAGSGADDHVEIAQCRHNNECRASVVKTTMTTTVLRKLGAVFGDNFVKRRVCSELQPQGSGLKVDTSTQVDLEVQRIAKPFSDTSATGSHTRNGHVRHELTNGKCGESVVQPTQPPVTSLELTSRVRSLEKELESCKDTISGLRRTEEDLRARLSDHTKRQFETSSSRDCKGYRFEDITLDENTRPTLLIRRYNDLYSEGRLELLDAFDHEQAPGDDDVDQDGGTSPDVDSLNNEIVMTCVVASFEIAKQLLEQIRLRVRDALVASDVDNTFPRGGPSLDRDLDQLPSSLDNEVSSFLVRTAHKRDISHDVEAVLERLFTSPVFRNHSSFDQRTALTQFATASFRLSWTLTVLRPPYSLIYDITNDDRMKRFSPDRHKRYHTSDPDSVVVRSVIWPGLEERDTGSCVCKAVVVT